MVRRRRSRQRRNDYSDGLHKQDAPNAVWAADFKGHFKLRTGIKCYLLTISDGCSRFLLRCHGMQHPTHDNSKAVFEAAFHEYGLPGVMRTDNGAPFSSVSGISMLSLWWIKLGIKPERIERGKSTQNGRHERIHRTLKAEVLTGKTPKSSFWSQQREFDHFRQEYNEERPHEALGQTTPSSVYKLSARRYPTKLREPEYGDAFTVQRATNDGSIEVAGQKIRLSIVLAQKPIGLLEQEDGSMEVHYGPLQLATISRKGRLRRGSKRRSSKPAAEEKSPETSVS